MGLTPIALFTYNRPYHTQKTLDALSNNPEAKESVLYVFCDGPKAKATSTEIECINKVFEIVKNENRFKDVRVTIQEHNLGLANSIVSGVTKVINEHEKVIVLEDDIVTSIGFLKYMNDALLLYENNKDVMHISGYMYPHKRDLPETFFYKVPLCWGWATWKSSWKCFNEDAVDLWLRLAEENTIQDFDKFGYNFLSKQLAYNITGKLNTWFIKWHGSVYLKGGYSLFPRRSLVNNIGFDDSGVHNRKHKEFLHETLESNINVNKIDFVENHDAVSAVKTFYDSLISVVERPSLKQQFKQKIKQLTLKAIPGLKDNLAKPKISLNRSYLGNQVKLYVKARLNNSIVGNYTYISENAIINNTIIGKFCSIGPNLISGWGLHPIDGVSSHPMFYSTAKQNGMSLVTSNKFVETKSIQIGHDVFIGMNVIILDGVSIGNGAIIGAGSVVSKDIPPYAIAIGNPIKVIKYRFEDDVIKKLLDLKWWDFNVDQLKLVERYFYDISKFIKVCDENINPNIKIEKNIVHES